MESPKIFFARLRDIAGRLDPRYHSPLFSNNISRIRMGHCATVGDCCEMSEETWNKATLFPDMFPYVEIGAINTEDGDIATIEEIPTAEAPSRAQMVIRSGDILVSMTRPTRNAIARVTTDIGTAIASTGFAVIRYVDRSMVLRDYLFHVLRLGFCTLQFDQRSSGGNYPAVTKEDLRKILIPLPPLDVQEQFVAELDAAYAAKRAADEKATKLLATIDDIVLEALGIPPIPPADTSLVARTFTVSARDVANRRLDAIANQCARRQFIRSVKASPFPVQTLGSLSDVERWQTDDLKGRIYVGMENIDGEWGDYVPTGVKEDISSGVVFKKGDILVPRLRPYLNKIWLASFDGVASTEFYPLVAQGVSSGFLAAFLRTRAVANVLTILMTGNTLPRVQIEDVLSLPIPVPPKDEQEEIVAKVISIRAKAKRLKVDAQAALVSAKKRIESEIIGK